MSMDPSLARRRFLLGASALGAGALVVGCTSNESGADQPQQVAQGGADNAKPGKEITIGFSAPAADHGWIAAITKNAQAQADAFSDVTFKATQGTNDVNQQISQVETLINDKVDVLVILPHDGKALTATGQQAMDAGIPVINLDRIFDTPLAYRTWIGGDNYRMGVNAGAYIAAQMKEKGVSNPVIGEVAGIDALPLTQQRSKGFKDALSKAGFSVGPRVAAEFTVEVPDLTLIARRAGGVFPRDRIVRIIDGRSVLGAHGSRTMPVWGEELGRLHIGDPAAPRATQLIVDRLADYVLLLQRPARN